MVGIIGVRACIKQYNKTLRNFKINFFFLLLFKVQLDDRKKVSRAELGSFMTQGHFLENIYHRNMVGVDAKAPKRIASFQKFIVFGLFSYQRFIGNSSKN